MCSHCWRSTVATGRTTFPSLKIFQNSCRVCLKHIKEPNQTKDLSCQWGWCFQRWKSNPYLITGSLRCLGTSISLCPRFLSKNSRVAMVQMLRYCDGGILLWTENSLLFDNSTLFNTRRAKKTINNLFLLRGVWIRINQMH